MKKYIKKIYIFCCITILCVVISLPIAAETLTDNEVYLGGMPFGVRFDAGEVMVIKTNSFISDGKNVSPSEDAGICPNDIIRSINGVNINTMYDVVNTVQTNEKDILEVIIDRSGKEMAIKLEPLVCDDTGKRQMGVILKDSSAGIGTVTFIEADTLTFAGLGHGICNSTDGKLLKIENGYISNVTITDINKGKIGSPGELRGIIDSEKCGKLLSNTEVGIYGIFTEAPIDLAEKIELAKKNEVKPGEATILCTLDDNVRKEYEIEISKIQNFTNSKTKNFVIKVTDKELLAKTGGIVQGMSGSPIIQNGKLVGAITHVLINDPTTGYGILIENMMDAA